MTFIKRLHLRDNWPLWVGGLALILAVLYSMIGILNPISYPIESAVIYPVYLIYYKTRNILFWLTILGFALVVISAFVATLKSQYYWITVCILGGSFFLCAMDDRIFSVAILVNLVGITFITLRSIAQKGIAICLIVLAICAYFPFFRPSIVDFQHLGSRPMDAHNYSLAQIHKTDSSGYIEIYFLVYECDSLGLICIPGYVSDGYIPYREQTLTASLVMDISQNNLYIQLGTQQFHVAPQAK
jgi:hypothetical protein